jgi:propanol-preferring alcohol dehydrogenase
VDARSSAASPARRSKIRLQFSAAHDVAAMTEVLPFEDASEAYARMINGKASFRVVLSMQSQ